jgi:hypothetical protein
VAFLFFNVDNLLKFIRIIKNMSLYDQLQKAKSEEDVKDAYIKALGLKGYTKGLIDIQSNEIWFEAKDTGRHFRKPILRIPMCVMCAMS